MNGFACFISTVWDLLFRFNDFQKLIVSICHLSFSLQSFQYLKTKDNVAQNFLKHIGNSSVNELLLKVVQCDETAEGSGIVKVCLIILFFY